MGFDQWILFLKIVKNNNKMNYLLFREKLFPMGVFSIFHVKIFFPEFDNRRLVEWQEKGFLKKIVNKWYVFSEIELGTESLYRIANKIYKPSYVSLESAFSYYNLIPESVFTITSVSSNKTSTFHTLIGQFSYRSLKSTILFGYQIKEFRGSYFDIADLEKCLLDFLYLNPTYNSLEDFKSLRLNPSVLLQIKWELLEDYLKVFKNKTLEKRVESLKIYFNHVRN
jgi:predicted transcriptional regulator of viral defense system